jgi:hypothetical protein
MLMSVSQPQTQADPEFINNSLQGKFFCTFKRSHEQVITHGGTAGKKDRPASGVLVTAQVDSVDECLKKIVAAGAEHCCPEAGDSECGLPGAFQGSGGKCHRHYGK